MTRTKVTHAVATRTKVTHAVAPRTKVTRAARDWWAAAHDDRGIGTVLALAIIGVTVALLSGALLIAGAVLATHRARSAADLAALAGASRLLRGADEGTVCDVARQVAADNGATLTECRTSGGSAAIELTTDAPDTSGPAPAMTQGPDTTMKQKSGTSAGGRPGSRARVAPGGHSSRGGGGGRVLGSPGTVAIDTAVAVTGPLQHLGPARAHAIAGAR